MCPIPVTTLAGAPIVMFINIYVPLYAANCGNHNPCPYDFGPNKHNFGDIELKKKHRDMGCEHFKIKLMAVLISTPHLEIRTCLFPGGGYGNKHFLISTPPP